MPGPTRYQDSPQQVSGYCVWVGTRPIEQNKKLRNTPMWNWHKAHRTPTLTSGYPILQHPDFVWLLGVLNSWRLAKGWSRHSGWWLRIQGTLSLPTFPTRSHHAAWSLQGWWGFITNHEGQGHALGTQEQNPAQPRRGWPQTQHERETQACPVSAMDLGALYVAE